MSQQGQVLIALRSQLGVVESGGPDGHSGNIVPYWDWWKKVTGQNDQGQSWCACFISWGFAQAKLSNLVAAKNQYGFIYCPDLENWAKAGHATIVTDKTKGMPGDIILFDWEGKGIADHVGFIQKNLSPAPFYLTIEGNTSGEGILGSQNNGGGVYERHRHIDATIRMIVRPKYLKPSVSLTSTTV